MSRPLTLLLSLLAVSAALAGCAEDGANNGTPSGNTTSAPPGADTSAYNAQPVDGKCVSNVDAARTAASPVWVLETTLGTMRITLFCDKAPLTAQSFVNLTERGYFDGTRFHRVIKDFMNQGGDPNSKDAAKINQWGTGGPGYTLVDEFWCADGTISTTHPASCPTGLGLKHDTPGVLSMANTGRARTGGSQFFITAVPTPHLDGKHAIFGHTADQASLDIALAINKVRTDAQDRPMTSVFINKASLDWG